MSHDVPHRLSLCLRSSLSSRSCSSQWCLQWQLCELRPEGRPAFDLSAACSQPDVDIQRVERSTDVQLWTLVIHSAFNPQMDCETKMSLWPAHVKHPEKQNAVSHTGQISCGFPSLSVCTDRHYVIQVSCCHAKTSRESFKCSQLTRLK